MDPSSAKAAKDFRSTLQGILSRCPFRDFLFQSHTCSFSGESSSDWGLSCSESHLAEGYTVVEDFLIYGGYSSSWKDANDFKKRRFCLTEQHNFSGAAEVTPNQNLWSINTKIHCRFLDTVLDTLLWNSYFRYWVVIKLLITYFTKYSFLYLQRHS